MTRCTHDHIVCEHRWRTEGRPCCGVCSHVPTGAEGRRTGKHCRWVDGQRLLLTHLRSCTAAGCEGCEPCGKRHCEMPRCSRHLRREEPTICNRCVGAVRDDLGRIADLCRIAPAAATESGTSSPVAVLVGPVPEHSTYTARRAWAVGGGVCRCKDCPDLQPLPDGPVCSEGTDCTHHVCRRLTGRTCCPGILSWLDDDAREDRLHPRWILGAWDWLAAVALGHSRTLKVTVATAVTYLDANLTDLSRSDDFAFDDFAREVAECKAHVEQVLLVARYVEKGAPCPECGRAGRKPKPLECHFDPDDTSGESDLWICPTCEEVWTQDQYDKYVEREFLTHALRLTAAQIQQQYQIPGSTVRRWASGWRDRGVDRPPIVRRRGKDQQGRQLYDVADVLAARERKEQTA